MISCQTKLIVLFVYHIIMLLRVLVRRIIETNITTRSADIRKVFKINTRATQWGMGREVGFGESWCCCWTRLQLCLALTCQTHTSSWVFLKCDLLSTWLKKLRASRMQVVRTRDSPPGYTLCALVSKSPLRASVKIAHFVVRICCKITLCTSVS